MKLNQNLYITYSNQKARNLKSNPNINPLDKIITLDALILEMYESNNFEIIIDDIIGSSLIYKIIEDNDIEYFDYLDSDAASLKTIYDYIVKSNQNKVSFETILKSDKLDAIIKINIAYLDYKFQYNLADIADIEQNVLQNWDEYFKDFNKNYHTIFIDSFKIGDISYSKSFFQEKILEGLANNIQLPFKLSHEETKILKPLNEVFDNIDEVKTALKIARKLLEEGASSDDILIVASDIQEYAPLYKLFLDEYELKGYSSIGTPLSSFLNSTNPKVQIALNNYNLEIKQLTELSNKLNLKLSDKIKQNIKSSIAIQDEKVGIELTEPNQVVGLDKKYKYVIFIGTDINHFPPKASDNFLYSYENEIEYFHANNYFTSSFTQLDELKRLSENLYIITASYSGKRELSPSILLDGNYDDTIDVSAIKSINELALENKTTKLDLSYFDDVKVEGINATHLSASQINNYLGCPLRYLYSSKIKLQSPNQSEEGFDVMEQGSLMHLCYELFGRKIKDHHILSIDKEEQYDLMYKCSIEAYNHEETTKNRNEENIHHKIFLNSLQSGLKDDRDAGLLVKFVDYYITNADEFNYFKNTEFEKEFVLDDNLEPCKLKGKDDKNYFIKGFIDRFDNLENHINIVDYKSKKVSRVDKDKQEEVDTQKDIQLSLYILYANQQYSNKNYDSHLLSFKGNEKGVKFATLSNDDVYTDEFENDLKQLIFDTKDNIETGKFGFNNSDEKMCGYCDVKNICQAKMFTNNKEIKIERRS